jgi:hypothetical protein
MKPITTSFFKPNGAPLISAAEKGKTLYGGQYGSRPGCDALIPAFIKEMKNEICYVIQNH